MKDIVLLIVGGIVGLLLGEAWKWLGLDKRSERFFRRQLVITDRLEASLANWHSLRSSFRFWSYSLAIVKPLIAEDKASQSAKHSKNELIT